MSKNKENKKVENNTASVSKAVDIIKNLVNLVGITAGIIIASIGGVMFLNSILKLYIFDIKTDRFSSFEYRCNQFDLDNIRARKLVGGGFNPMPIEVEMIEKNNQKNKKLTEEDKKFLKKKYEECIEKAKKDDEEAFVQRKKMDLTDGLAFLIVGFALLFFYQRRKKN